MTSRPGGTTTTRARGRSKGSNRPEREGGTPREDSELSTASVEEIVKGVLAQELEKAVAREIEQKITNASLDDNQQSGITQDQVIAWINAALEEKGSQNSPPTATGSRGTFPTKQELRKEEKGLLADHAQK